MQIPGPHWFSSGSLECAFSTGFPSDPDAVGLPAPLWKVPDWNISKGPSGTDGHPLFSNAQNRSWLYCVTGTTTNHNYVMPQHAFLLRLGSAVLGADQQDRSLEWWFIRRTKIFHETKQNIFPRTLLKDGAMHAWKTSLNILLGLGPRCQPAFSRRRVVFVLGLLLISNKNRL